MFGTFLSVKPQHLNIRSHTLHTLLYTFFFCTDKENLFNNQSFLGLAIVSFILMILVIQQ